ncbi:DNA-binding FrmR family transcriptional regulator [Microbacterium immunditiarum]|uniref:DNA-binding FrmR family transcriptional regulator n=2 Tax=Microbacterium immunditiarum TaxID=337480 RepID=A0A7Y9GNK7_9MICO|nr:metal-sensitive transcriptional regulator [Microbacterium immunditiarum]NYE19771.1 DNA-binding FrmR family transcriptional regulator [Microbacterium immunditiarum]
MMITGTPEEQAATRKRISHRLRRAQGQLTAVIGAIESGGSCRDIVTQLSAVSSALDRAGFAIVSAAMRDCVLDPDAAADAEGLTVEELEKLFMALA